MKEVARGVFDEFAYWTGVIKRCPTRPLRIWNVCWKNQDEIFCCGQIFVHGFKLPRLSDQSPPARPSTAQTTSAAESLSASRASPPAEPSQPAEGPPSCSSSGSSGFVKLEVICDLPVTRHHSKTIRRVAFGGEYLGVASFDAKVTIWEKAVSKAGRIDEGWEVVATLEGHENEVKGLSMKPNLAIATSGRDHSVWMHARNKAEVPDNFGFYCQDILAGHTQDVKSVEMHPLRDDLAVSTSYDTTVKIWQSDGAGDWALLQTFPVSKKTVWEARWSPDGTHFVACSDDGILKVFRAPRNRPFKSILTHTGLGLGKLGQGVSHPSETPLSERASPDGGEDEERRFSLQSTIEASGSLYSCDWITLDVGSSKMDFIACAGGEGIVRVYGRPVGSGEWTKLSEFVGNGGCETNSVRFSPNPNALCLATGGDDGILHIFAQDDSLLAQ